MRLIAASFSFSVVILIVIGSAFVKIADRGSGQKTNEPVAGITLGLAGAGTGVTAALGQSVTDTIGSPTFTGALTARGLVTTADLAAQAANTVLANATGGAASPTAQTVPSCSAYNSALIWTSNAGIGCNTAITAVAQVPVSASAKTISSFDCFTRQVLTQNNSGPNYTITLPATSAVPANCWLLLSNTDVYVGYGTVTGRARVVVANGGNAWKLYPGMSVQATALASGQWQLDGPRRWTTPSVPITVYSDFVNGNSDETAVDGLAPVGGAYRSASEAYYDVSTLYDMHGIPQTTVNITMAPHTTDTVQMHLADHALVGGQGGAAISIHGATLAVTGAASSPGSGCSSAGAIRLTHAVDPSSTYSNGEAVNIFGIVGTTEANRPWQLCVVDSTHVDLVGSSFVNTYVSGGAITDGSILAPAVGPAIQTYFGTVIELHSITFGKGISANLKSIIYVYEGNLFATPSSGDAQIDVESGGIINVLAEYGISGSAAFHITSQEGIYLNQTPVDFLPNSTFAFTQFVAAAYHSALVATGAVNTRGSTVTGQRFNVSLGSALQTATGNPNTDLPGNSAGVATQGSVAGNGPMTTSAGGTGLTTSPLKYGYNTDPGLAGTTNQNGVMTGLGAYNLFTPQTSGNMLFTVTLSATNTTTSDGCSLQLRYGTGTPPANGATLTGSTAGQPLPMTVAVASQQVPMTLSAYQTGLIPFTTYWLDVSEAAVGGGTCSFVLSAVTLLEQ